jgi:hypothetical protein
MNRVLSALLVPALFLAVVATPTPALSEEKVQWQGALIERSELPRLREFERRVAARPATPQEFGVA